MFAKIGLHNYEELQHDVKWVWVNTYRYILVGLTSIYQLFWGSLGTRVLTHPQMANNIHLENIPTSGAIQEQTITWSPAKAADFIENLGPATRGM